MQKVKQAADNTKQSADEIARTAAHSPSQSGDSVHSRGQAQITEEYYNKYLSFKKMVESALTQEVKAIKPPCYVELQFSDGRQTAFYLVKDPIAINGFVLVSISSPLGLVLIGKKQNSKFRHTATGKTLNGVIHFIQ